VYFRILESKALHCTLYHAEYFSFDFSHGCWLPKLPNLVPNPRPIPLGTGVPMQGGWGVVCRYSVVWCMGFILFVFFCSFVLHP
jgi:hypothetical protein